MNILNALLRNTNFNIIMKYIDDINNIRPIYILFCEYIASKPSNEKDELINRLLLLKSSYFIEQHNNRDIFRSYLKDIKTRSLFRNFIKIYISLNPNLVMYEEQLINMEFNSSLFKHELEELTFNTPCLK